MITRFKGASELFVSSTQPLDASRPGSDPGIGGMQVDPSEVLDIRSSVAPAVSGAAPAAGQETIVGGAQGDAVELSAGESIQIDPLQDAPSTQPANGAIEVSTGARVSRHYRGEIEIDAEPDGSLQVVNVVGVEEYLLGVLGPEIGSGCPVEALKAQAVASRTYALKNRGKMARAGVDLDDTTACQQYGGVESESPSIAAAVNATAGQVVVYNGALIDAYYDTDCGGETAPGGKPYLIPVSDPQCAQAPGWQLSIPIADFLTDLASVHGVSAPLGMDGISVVKTDASGRVLAVQISDSRSGQTCTVTASQLRAALGANELRSTLFSVSVDSTGQDCVFNGHGWGHGLGMCQHGAIAMAQASATYDQILAHYYSGTQLAQMNGSMLTAAAPIEIVRVRVDQSPKAPPASLSDAISDAVQTSTGAGAQQSGRGGSSSSPPPDL